MDNKTMVSATCYVAGKPVEGKHKLEVKSPYDNRLVGTVALANANDAKEAIAAAIGNKVSLSNTKGIAF